MKVNTKENIIIGTEEDVKKHSFYIKSFMHNDGHFGISICVNGKAITYHYIIKDMSKYDELINLLKLRLEFLCRYKKEVEERNEEFTIDKVCIYVENAVLYLNSYLDDYEVFEPQPRTEDEIAEYMEEAFNRVWLVRKQDMFCNVTDGIETIRPDILEQCKKAIIEVCEKYNIDFNEPVCDWKYGYWSGILTALRWALGDEKDSLDT